MSLGTILCLDEETETEAGYIPHLVSGRPRIEPSTHS